MLLGDRPKRRGMLRGLTRTDGSEKSGADIIFIGADCATLA